MFSFFELSERIYFERALWELTVTTRTNLMSPSVNRPVSLIFLLPRRSGDKKRSVEGLDLCVRAMRRQKPNKGLGRIV